MASKQAAQGILGGAPSVRAADSRTLYEAADLIRIAGLVGAGALSRAVPQSLDARWAAVLDAAGRTLLPGAVRETEAKMRRALPSDCGVAPETAAGAFWRMRIEDAWGRARGLRLFGWSPCLVLEGQARLESALARGHGAILWSMRFASATAIKQAFYFAGYPLVHLSHARHGSPSASRLGLGVAAPLYCRAENPYLRERVVIPASESLAYFEKLSAALRANACVSIFAEHPGRRSVERKVLTGSVAFATGAPSLAWSEGAALLTVSAHREGPFHYRVEIGEEIPVDRSLPRKAFAEAAIEELVRRLEDRITRFPADWQGWSYHEMPARQAGGKA